MTRAARTSEREFQDTLVGVLELFGYVVEHTYPLLTRPKSGQPVWRTGSTLKGKPDLIAVRPPRLLAIEVKTEVGRPSPEQVAVLSMYSEVPCARAWLVTPDDPPWADVQAWIRQPQPAPRTHGFEPMGREEYLRVIDASRRRKQRSKLGSTGGPPSLPLGP
jgi:hypothetical protein